MFNSVFQHSIVMAAVAGVSIILAAVYTLWMIQKVFYGEVREGEVVITKVPVGTTAMLVVLVILVIAFGVYPQGMLNVALTK